MKYRNSCSYLEFPHGLVEMPQVAIMLGCLDIELSEGLPGLVE